MDIYDDTEFEGSLNKGTLILKKRHLSSGEEPKIITYSLTCTIIAKIENTYVPTAKITRTNDYFTDDTAADPHRRVFQVYDILRHTMIIEENDPKVVSFSVKREYYANYNIKFTSEGQARHLVTYKVTRHNFFVER